MPKGLSLATTVIEAWLAPLVESIKAPPVIEARIKEKSLFNSGIESSTVCIGEEQMPQSAMREKEKHCVPVLCWYSLTMRTKANYFVFLDTLYLLHDRTC